MKHTVLSFFSGIGAFEKALDRCGIEYDLLNYCEINSYASKSYAAIHGVPESMNLGDITKVDEKNLPKNVDLLTYGFPCQDISASGKQKGLLNDDGSKTRSGLVFDMIRIIQEVQPRIAIAENVKALTSKKFSQEFRLILSALDEAGYNTTWCVLNATEFGLPQNRERVFIVSIRKDIKKKFAFPLGFPLEYCLADFLEHEVDEKYYLSQKAIDGFNKHRDKNKENGNGFGWKPTHGETVAHTIKANGNTRPDDNYIIEPNKNKVNQIGNLYEGSEQFKNRVSGRIYSAEGLCPTLRTPSGGNNIPLIKLGNTSPGGKSQCNDGYSIEGVYPTITAGTHGNANPSILVPESKPVIVDDFYKSREPRVYEDIAPTIRAHRSGLKVVEPAVLSPGFGVTEPNVLVAKRTEYGKAIRKSYESGEITESRHNMTELSPRKDGIANTITTVQTDNLLVVPVVVPVNTMPDGTARTIKAQYYKTSAANILDNENIGSAYKATGAQCGERIRRLTPKECFRLQGFSDEDFEKAKSAKVSEKKTMSDTQLYKQAGNSIAVNVLEYLFAELVNADLL